MQTVIYLKLNECSDALLSLRLPYMDASIHLARIVHKVGRCSTFNRTFLAKTTLGQPQTWGATRSRLALMIHSARICQIHEFISVDTH